MALYATGFNAWSQLQFENSVGEEPDDISSFTCVLHTDAIDHVRPFFSYTLVHDGIKTLSQYPSIQSLLSNSPSHTFPNLPNITQLVAYDTGFAALSSTGQVWTWGDERYAACLGRDVTDESPAEAPGLVPDLSDLPTGPVTKLAAGGYFLAALTAGDDLYCWGHAGRSPILGDLFSNSDADVDTDRPNLVVIGQDNDVADIAVGDAHLVALTSDGEVYVIGDNGNGQLGLPGKASARSWTWISLETILGTNQSIVTGVAAGPKSSFLVVRNNSH
ncbi:E3 ubiquitin-protein ligase HERC2 [Madurella mycetomatis]|uniref:E3 ubiquitin-protein ligase HERC2 n=1 Tax=Madurella mycetomatis TaxID=100816 RepID=A0A175W950_9PEZI|nr:E3 ubiquitin-protein ligase HERC2 [Madurella mycetomatis]